MEKREQERYYDHGSVVCSHFNAPTHHDGQVLNFSLNGMCFRSDRFFKPGSAVLIRLNDIPTVLAARQEEGGMRTTTLAKVQWCLPDEDRPDPLYTSGVRYL